MRTSLDYGSRVPVGLFPGLSSPSSVSTVQSNPMTSKVLFLSCWNKVLAFTASSPIILQTLQLPLDTNTHQVKPCSVTWWCQELSTFDFAYSLMPTLPFIWLISTHHASYTTSSLNVPWLLSHLLLLSLGELLARHSILRLILKVIRLYCTCLFTHLVCPLDLWLHKNHGVMDWLTSKTWPIIVRRLW